MHAAVKGEGFAYFIEERLCTRASLVSSCSVSRFLGVPIGASFRLSGLRLSPFIPLPIATLIRPQFFLRSRSLPFTLPHRSFVLSLGGAE